MSAAKYKEWIGDNGRAVLTAWGMNGLTDEQIAKNMGVTARTLYLWKNQHPEIEKAIEVGRIVASMNVANALYESAKGRWIEERSIERKEDGNYVLKLTKKYIPPDVKAIIFYLTNRCPDKWKLHPDERNTETDEMAAKVKALLDGIPSAF